MQRRCLSRACECNRLDQEHLTGLSLFSWFSFLFLFLVPLSKVFILYFSVSLFGVFYLLKKLKAFECHWGRTLPLINPRSCYCKQWITNTACVHMWAKRNGQSDQILTWFRWAMSLYRGSASDWQRSGDSLSLSLWEDMSPPLATTIYLCLLSLYCAKYPRKTSNAHLCIKDWACLFIHFIDFNVEISCSECWEHGCDRVLSLIFSHKVSQRGNPFEMSYALVGLLEAPCSVNAYTRYWHIMLCMVM